MKNIFKLVGIIALTLAFTNSWAIQKRKVVFSPDPYIKRYNAKVGMQYKVVKADMPNGESINVIKWKKGKHKLIIKGRESGSRLEKIFIGKVDEKPSENSGININIADGKITSPMILKEIKKVKTLVGAKDKGTAEYNFDIKEDGAYVLWGKACGVNHQSNSFCVIVDNGPTMIWDVALSYPGKTKWTKIKGRGASYYAHFAFWLSWGATSPLSKWRNNKELRKLAMYLTETRFKIMTRRADPHKQKQSLWFIEDLELIRMWQLDKRTPRATVDKMMKMLKPYVKRCCTRAMTSTCWDNNAPNILLQEATILRLASVMWQNKDSVAAKKWAEISQKRVKRAIKLKIPGSAFGYSYGSGTDAAYFNNDSRFLSRYYMLTKDPEVLAALKDMAIVATTVTSHGLPLSFGSPWWKHTYWGYNNTGSISEMILAASKNPQYARVVELMRKRIFSDKAMRGSYDSYDQGIGVYYNMLMPEITVEVAPIKNECYLSHFENGPALRFNDINIAMPWRPWCESTCGATFANHEKVISQVSSVILTALTKDTIRSFARTHFAEAYSIVEDLNPKPDVRVIACAKDFIASVTSFRPNLGLPSLRFTINKENKSPWQRTDIYFADKNGFAGSLELKALRDNNCYKVVLWSYVSKDAKSDKNKICLNGLTIDFEKKYSGKIKNLGSIWAKRYPNILFESVLKNAGKNGFKKGETFNATVAVNGKNSSNLSIGAKSIINEIHYVNILRGGKQYASLLFNSSKQIKSWENNKKYKNIYQSTKSGYVKKLTQTAELKLSPESLTILIDSNIKF
jgi:hypothetical protein